MTCLKSQKKSSLHSETWQPKTVLLPVQGSATKESKAAIDVTDRGERWVLLVLVAAVVIGLAMLPA
jgi:hypothetical protein